MNLAQLSTDDSGWIFVNGQPHLNCGSVELAIKVRGEIEAGVRPLLRYAKQAVGAGDHLQYAGAALVLAARHGGYTIPFRPQDEATVRSIYIDHPEITLIDATVFCRNPPPDNLLICRDEKLWLKDTDVDQYERGYRKYSIPYSARWDRSPILEACKKVEQVPVPEEGEYIFVHQDPQRKFWIPKKRLPDLPIFQPKFIAGRSILCYRDAIQQASEVHVIDSCFLWLAEMTLPKCKLVWHRYARGKLYMPMNNNYRFRHAWEVLN